MKIALTETFFVNWLMLNIYDIVLGDLDWIVNERVLGYGDNVTLFCAVDDCCKKTAGWIKFDPDYTTIFLDVRDFKYETSKEDKYAAITNSTGFGLVIKNIREDDFNIKYLCSYGFKKSRQKVLYQSDVFRVDEPQSKLLLAGKVIGSITAVVILLVPIVLIVRWRRKKNLKQNENSSESTPLKLEKKEWNKNNIMKSEENTTTKNVTSLTKTVDELYKDDQISQSERLLQNDVATLTVEPSSEDHENNHRTQPELLRQNDEAVIQTAENSSKDNQSTHQPEESQKTVKNLILDLENKSENITYMHEDKENDSKE